MTSSLSVAPGRSYLYNYKISKLNFVLYTVYKGGEKNDSSI